MAQAFAELEASDETAALTHVDWLGLLVDRELTHRRDKRLAARLRYARLRQPASVEDVDYRAPRGLDRRSVPQAHRWRMDRHARQSDFVRADRRGQILACLCSRSQGLPRQPLGPLSAGSQAVPRTRARPR